MASSMGTAPSGVTSASLTDAMGRLATHPAHVLDLVSPTPGRVLWGQAVTIQFLPTRSDRDDPPFNQLFYEAIRTEEGFDGSGKVLVLAAGQDVSVAGGTKLARLATNGFAGVATDGRLRDFHELRDEPIAAYCRGETVRWGGDRVQPVQANVPIALGTVRIEPGDWIYADEAGLVVIPDALVDDVVKEARTIEADDAAARNRILQEDPEAIWKQGTVES